MKKYVYRNYDNTKTLKENLLNNRENIKDIVDNEEIIMPNLTNMDKFVDRIINAIKNKEYIGILSDTDADGTGGACILYTGLTSIPKCNCIQITPCSRYKGYGILKDYYDDFKRIGVTLALTTDIGVSNKNEIEYGKMLGIETLVSDHHHSFADSRPDCIIVNPADEDENSGITPYCGAGVAYILMKKLYEKLDLPFDEDKKMLGFCTISTISDMVPLIGQNYTLVKEGLKSLRNTKSKPLKWILENAIRYDSSKRALSSTDISFGIAPMINSLNRVSDPQKALDFFLSEDDNTIHTLGRYLIDRNTIRKEQQIQSIIDVESTIKKKKMEGDNIMFIDMTMNKSICGLTASYISSDSYFKPAIVVTKNLDTGIYYGSMRSVGDCSLISLIEDLKPLCEKAGGHAMAAGLSFHEDNFDKISKLIKDYGIEHSDKIYHNIYIDGELKISEINDSTIREIYSVQPYGMENPAPVFFTKNLQVADVECRRFNTFMKLEEVSDELFSFDTDIVSFDAVAFKRDYSEWLNPGDRVNILYELAIDKTILIKDIKKIS